jgi:hypothetical protein
VLMPRSDDLPLDGDPSIELEDTFKTKQTRIFKTTSNESTSKYPSDRLDTPRESHDSGSSSNRSLRGSSSTTLQLNLQDDEDTQRLLDLDQGSGETNAYVLQPADYGFGAWSYAASAFAMFTVVWGKF